jgi:Family of unknown function (DUF6056)
VDVPVVLSTRPVSTTPGPDVNARRNARTFWALCAAIWLFFAIMSWLSPLQGDDWLPRYWIARQGGGVGSLLRWLIYHRQLGDLVSMVLVGLPWLHVVVTPIVIIGFFVGLVALAQGRVPRPRDPVAALYVLITSTLIWIGAPHAGVDFYYRSNLAFFVYGLTAVVWLLFLFNNVDVRPGWTRVLGVFVLAVAAGDSNHHIVPLVGYALWRTIRRRRAAGRVPAWMWAGLVGLAIGAGLLFTMKPYLPLKGIFHGGFEHNVFRLYLFMGECGELVSLVMVTFFALVIRARFRPPGGPWPDGRAIGRAGWAYGAALLAAILAVFAPRWGEPGMLGSVAALTVGAMALFERPLEIPGLRRVAVAASVVLWVLAVLYSVPRYLGIRDTFLQRVAALEAAPKGGVGHIQPYRTTVPDSWFIGDDMGRSTPRALVAVIFGLRAIEYDKPFGALEQSAGFTFDEVFEPGGRVRLLTDDLDAARNIFGEDARERWRGGWRGTAQLEVVGGLDWPTRRGRARVAARFADGEVETPGYDFLPLDRRQRFSLYFDRASLDGFYPFGYVVASNQDIPFDWDGDDHWILPQRADRYTLLACNDAECWVVMSLWYHL